MFVGAINMDMRAIVYEIAQQLKDVPVYVGCSGNFTIERVLAKTGAKEIHSNDVSLYSCCLGGYLSGREMQVQVEDREFVWLEEFMKPGLPTIATLMLCSEMFKYTDRQEPYHKRMLKAYTTDFETMHRATQKKIARALEEIHINSFSASDVVDFISDAPSDAAVISFPPTYKGGYEKIYKKFDQVFAWDAPQYQVFDDKRFQRFLEAAQEKRYWLTMRDQPVPELESSMCALVQTGARSRPVYLYSNISSCRLTLPRQKIEPIRVERLGERDEIAETAKLSLSEITQAQMNGLRSQYLNPSIIPSAATVNLAVLADGRLVGALGLSRSNYPWCSAYMMADFAIGPIRYKRLAKLILAVAISEEVQVIAEQRLGIKIKTIGTTAFTTKPVSMKYRGIFDLYSRKEDSLNYIAQAGKWSLKRGLCWWIRKHSSALSN